MGFSSLCLWERPAHSGAELHKLLQFKDNNLQKDYPHHYNSRKRVSRTLSIFWILHLMRITPKSGDNNLARRSVFKISRSSQSEQDSPNLTRRLHIFLLPPFLDVYQPFLVPSSTPNLFEVTQSSCLAASLCLPPSLVDYRVTLIHSLLPFHYLPPSLTTK